MSYSRCSRTERAPHIAIRALRLALCAGAVLVVGCSSDGTPRNESPVMSAQADTSVAVGDTLFLSARATDVDGDNFSFALKVGVEWREIHSEPTIEAGLDPVTGEFWFRANSRDRPNRRFVFVVEDEHGNQDFTEFVVNVQ
jgi:hypothetical protein